MRLVWVLRLVVLGCALVGCAAPPKRSLVEDQTRRVAPIPACVLYLPARRAETTGTLRKLREEQIVKLMFPTFDEEKRTLPKGAPACTGRAVLDDPALVGGSTLRGWPFVEQEGDVVYGSGGDRIKLVWLKAVGFADGTVGGPIAIVRSGERFAELFAIGAYRGRPDRVQLSTQRVGTDLVVTAQEDACAGRKPKEPCENKLAVLLPRRGILGRVAEIPIERVAYGGEGERGSTGTLEYRLTTSADYKVDGIHLLEQIKVNDEAGRELRKAELERLFAVDDVAGTIASTQPALWDRVVQSSSPKESPERSPRRH